MNEKEKSTEAQRTLVAEKNYRFLFTNLTAVLLIIKLLLFSLCNLLKYESSDINRNDNVPVIVRILIDALFDKVIHLIIK